MVNLIASVLFFSLDQQRPIYLTGHPLSAPKNGTILTAVEPLASKSPPRCRVNGIIKPN